MMLICIPVKRTLQSTPCCWDRWRLSHIPTINEPLQNLSVTWLRLHPLKGLGAVVLVRTWRETNRNKRENPFNHTKRHRFEKTFIRNLFVKIFVWSKPQSFKPAPGVWVCVFSLTESQLLLSVVDNKALSHSHTNTLTCHATLKTKQQDKKNN